MQRPSFHLQVLLFSPRFYVSALFNCFIFYLLQRLIINPAYCLLVLQPIGPLTPLKEWKPLQSKIFDLFSGSLRNCSVWDQAFGEGLERKTKSPTAISWWFQSYNFLLQIAACCLSRFKSSKSQKWIIFPSHLSMRPDSWPHCGVPYGWVVILTLFLQFYVNLGNYDDSIRNYNNTAKLAQLIW